MNLQQLEYFKVVSQTNNFTTASNILSITQPALSKAISKLEGIRGKIIWKRRA